jgi:hypothetical protein
MNEGKPPFHFDYSELAIGVEALQAGQDCFIHPDPDSYFTPQFAQDIKYHLKTHWGFLLQHALLGFKSSFSQDRQVRLTSLAIIPSEQRCLMAESKLNNWIWLCVTKNTGDIIDYRTLISNTP